MGKFVTFYLAGRMNPREQVSVIRHMVAQEAWNNAAINPNDW